MKFKTAKTLVIIQATIVAALMASSRAHAAVLDVSIAGYYGSNFLSDRAASLPNGTTVDFGLFYSNGFTSQSAISTALGAANSLAGMQNFRTSNGWISFATATVTDNRFSINMAALNSNGLVMDPASGPLTGLNLEGATAFLWVQTPDLASEFGVYFFKRTLPAMSGFADSVSYEATSADVTSLVGSTNPDGVITAKVAATTTAVPPVLVLKSLGTPQLVGADTSVVHRFSVSVPGNYVFEYTSNLSAGWSIKSLVVSSTADFDVTLTNLGVNCVSEWKNRMFFRIRPT